MFFKNKTDKIEGEIYTKVIPKNSNGYHCSTCKNCIESGNGNYLCQFGKPILIIEKEKVTKNYFWCNGKGYDSKY